jgi:hypothetical protein
MIKERGKNLNDLNFDARLKIARDVILNCNLL